MKSLLLITDGFPYGTSEQSFLQTEYKALAENFDVCILARNPQSTIMHEGYEGETVFTYEDRIDKSLLKKTVLCEGVISEVFIAIGKSKHTSSKLNLCKEIILEANLAYNIRPYIRNIIKQRKIEIVYTFWCTHATLAAVWLKEEFPGLKVISRFHGYDLYNERRPNNWQPYKQLIADKLDLAVFVSEMGRSYYKDHWNGDGRLHYLGTKCHQVIDENENGFVLVSCSNLIPLKRVELIISALSEIPEGIELKWYHFGDGSEREALENLAEKLLGKKDNVGYTFAGFVDNDTLTEMYCSIKPWLFITTSSSEGGAPVSIQEAFSMGIPCIGTNAGGIPDIVKDDYNGILLDVDPKINDVANAIERFCQLSPDERRQYRENAYNTWKQRFNAEENTKAFINEIKKITA